MGRTIALDKMVTKQVLSHYGLPTSKGVLVAHAGELERLGELQFPIVMKPIDGKQGTGVVVGLQTEPDAREAFFRRTDRRPVVFEEMLRGQEDRVVCVDFQFCAAAYRKPAFCAGGRAQHDKGDGGGKESRSATCPRA